ncbi:unnamed product [Ostreococcus tauri]|uniref:Unnamed product n=1 Tax=Ostreococcus tauri TaxID=70448 RepID=A0A096P9D7_OSTTA|nr:unnamed product [Ostreococcus tauri]CEG00868.1 unnamed product [Ostreococcus tauri]|eukprot:XP_022840634.1 unnamed product [Ostreococcus tauri]
MTFKIFVGGQRVKSEEVLGRCWGAGNRDGQKRTRHGDGGAGGTMGTCDANARADGTDAHEPSAKRAAT